MAMEEARRCAIPPYVFAVFAKVNAKLAVRALRTLHVIPILDNGGGMCEAGFFWLRCTSTCWFSLKLPLKPHPFFFFLTQS